MKKHVWKRAYGLQGGLGPAGGYLECQNCPVVWKPWEFEPTPSCSDIRNRPDHEDQTGSGE